MNNVFSCFRSETTVFLRHLNIWPISLDIKRNRNYFYELTIPKNSGIMPTSKHLFSYRIFLGHNNVHVSLRFLAKHTSTQRVPDRRMCMHR